jgi:hypothetical protein
VAVESSVAALDADLFEAGGVVGGPAGEVVREHAAGEFVEPVAFGFGAEFDEQASAEAEPACVGVDVDRVLADAFIDATVGVRAGSGPPTTLPACSATMNGRSSMSQGARSSGVRGSVSKVAMRSAIPAL